MTVSERYALAKGWTARHMVQDELIGRGKDAEWPAWLESKVLAAEKKDIADSISATVLVNLPGDHEAQKRILTHALIAALDKFESVLNA